MRYFVIMSDLEADEYYNGDTPASVSAGIYGSKEEYENDWGYPVFICPLSVECADTEEDYLGLLCSALEFCDGDDDLTDAAAEIEDVYGAVYARTNM